MQQRSEAHDSLDDFPTQPWGTRALLYRVLPGVDWHNQACLEPACNRGYMVGPLRERFGRVIAHDIHPYAEWWPGGAPRDGLRDFLCPAGDDEIEANPPDWMITNPPFRRAAQFIQRAFDLGIPNVAVLVRSAFLEGVGRYRSLYLPRPPTIVAQFTERLPLVKGRVDGNANSATAYCWLVWMRDVPPQPFDWVPPCRRQLERPGDYDAPQIIAADQRRGP